MTVFGTGGSSQGLEMALQNGAHKVFNHKESGYLDLIRVNFDLMLYLNIGSLRFRCLVKRVGSYK